MMMAASLAVRDRKGEGETEGKPPGPRARSEKRKGGTHQKKPAESPHMAAPKNMNQVVGETLLV